MLATMRPGLWVWSNDLFPDRDLLARARRKLDSEYDHCDIGDLAFGIRIPDMVFAAGFRENQQAFRRFSDNLNRRLGKQDFIMTDPAFPHDGYWLRFFLPYADNLPPNRMFATMLTRIIDGGVTVKMVSNAPHLDAPAVAAAHEDRLRDALGHPDAIAAEARLVTATAITVELTEGGTGVGLAAEVGYAKPFLFPWLHLYFSLRTLPRPFWPRIEFHPSPANAARHPRAEIIRHDFSPPPSGDR
jgi:hypothetical protein